MAMLPLDGAAIEPPHGPAPVDRLEKILRLLSVVTMVMTVPQVLTIWIGEMQAGSASRLS